MLRRFLMSLGFSAAALLAAARVQAAAQLLPYGVTDGQVNALAASNGVVYLGGSFSNVGTATGLGVPVDSTTGLADAVYPKVSGGQIQSVIPDGSGGWF